MLFGYSHYTITSFRTPRNVCGDEAAGTQCNRGETHTTGNDEIYEIPDANIILQDLKLSC